MKLISPDIQNDRLKILYVTPEKVPYLMWCLSLTASRYQEVQNSSQFFDHYIIEKCYKGIQLTSFADVAYFFKELPLMKRIVLAVGVMISDLTIKL